MKTRMQTNLCPGLAALALVSFLGGCGADSSTPPALHAVGAEAQAPDPMVIQVSEDMMKEISIGEPKWEAVNHTLRVSAMVQADETRIARVSSPVIGRILNLDVVEGQEVKRGQVLAVIRSTELSNSQLQFLKAFSQRQLSERAVERAKLLLEADVIGEAELQRRDSELAQARAEVSSARDELRVLGMSEESLTRLETSRTVNSVTQVVATIDGIVLERGVTLGQIVQPADTVAVLADLSKAWLVADVPEAQSGGLAVGLPVEAEVAALPGHTIRGKLSFVSARVDPETRTVRARMNLDNPRGRYKPAMLATMTLSEHAPKKRTVPVACVIREADGDHVFIQKSADTFALKPVKLAEEANGLRVLVDGVNPGEKIIVAGAFHLNNERRRRAIRGADGD